MADLSLDHITDLVAMRVGEFPDHRFTIAGGTMQSSLAEMVEVRLEEGARRLTHEAPLHRFSSAIDMRQNFSSLSISTDGSFAELILPDDFCRLTALRMPGWGATLNEDYTGDKLRSSMGENAPKWLKARCGRPWLRLTRISDRITLRFGPSTASIPDTATYIRLPVYDSLEKSLNGFDEALLSDLISLLSENIE